MTTIEQITNAMFELNNKHVDEFNELADTCELQQKELILLNKRKVDADKTLKMQDDALKILDKRSTEYKNELSRMSIAANSAKRLEQEVKVYRKETKVLKDQVKRVKAASVAKDSKIKKLEKNSVGGNLSGSITKDQFINNPNLGAIYTLFTNYANNGEIIQLYPHSLSITSAEGEKYKGFVLLYTSNAGTFQTLTLCDGDVNVVSPIRFAEDTPERTKKLVEKFVTKPSDQALEFAHNWMHKVNIVQTGSLKVPDLKRHEI